MMWDGQPNSVRTRYGHNWDNVLNLGVNCEKESHVLFVQGVNYETGSHVFLVQGAQGELYNKDNFFLERDDNSAEVDSPREGYF
jgi:hypothetical protein